MVIPEPVREQARINPGDEMDVGYANGLIVLRKRRPLTPSRVRSQGKLIDGVGHFDDAVTKAMQLGNVKKAKVITYRAPG